MTPSQRTELAELAAQQRAAHKAAERDPVEAAVYALASLTSRDRAEAISRFNKIFKDVPSVSTIVEQQKANA